MTAEAQLERLLWLIPAASGEEGSSLEELAAAMQSTVDDVMRDIEALTARAYYQRAGDGDDLQVLLDDDRLRIWTGGELRRPARLTVREALALGIGLRASALKHKGSRPGRMLNLARRLEQELAGVDVSELDRVHEVDLGADPAGVRSQIEQATREHRVVEIDYLKAVASAPERRRVKPYALVHAEGAWYVIGEGATGGDADDWRSRVRAFRVDRILDVLLRSETFEVPADFDVEEHLTGARVYRPHAGIEETEVEVRYAPTVARWIRERLAEDPAWAERTRDRRDGSLDVTHRVADLDWLVGHVLQYGPDAEVLSPASAREAVARAAARIAAL